MPSIPLMDTLGLNFFKTAITSSLCFLEYGVGGSTTYAINNAGVKNVISVDTSLEWISKINSSLSDRISKLHLKYCDLGEVGNWGTPINKDRINHFYEYMVCPWKIAKSNNLIPDLVLVDGRFRVACFLYSLICAEPKTTIMFDDYFNRAYYSVVEKFCPISERHGRMAVFQVEHNYSIPEIMEAIAKYSIVSA